MVKNQFQNILDLIDNYDNIKSRQVESVVVKRSGMQDQNSGNPNI